MDATVTGQTVLVTGGAGFVGSHIADAHLPDNDVRILDNFSSGKRENVPEDATLIQGDIRDDVALAEATEGVDIIFHQAAIVSVARSVEDPATSQAVNARGTLAVLEAARRQDARVVFASSAAIYGAPDALPVTETESKDPSSPYGLEKLTSDHYCRLYADLYDLPTVALRYFNIYGPRQSGGDYAGVIKAFTEQARDGGPLTVHGDGEQTRDFVNVADVVRANVLAADTDATGEAFNVGTGSRTSVRQLAEIVRDEIDPTAEITHVDAREGDIRHSAADITKARERLEFDPTISLADGLHDYLH